jgi:hypothetical protein
MNFALTSKHFLQLLLEQQAGLGRLFFWWIK